MPELNPDLVKAMYERVNSLEERMDVALADLQEVLSEQNAEAITKNNPGE